MVIYCLSIQKGNVSYVLLNFFFINNQYKRAAHYFSLSTIEISIFKPIMRSK